MKREKNGTELPFKIHNFEPGTAPELACHCGRYFQGIGVLYFECPCGKEMANRADVFAAAFDGRSCPYTRERRERWATGPLDD